MCSSSDDSNTGRTGRKLYPFILAWFAFSIATIVEYDTSTFDCENVDDIANIELAAVLMNLVLFVISAVCMMYFKDVAWWVYWFLHICVICIHVAAGVILLRYGNVCFYYEKSITTLSLAIWTFFIFQTGYFFHFLVSALQESYM